MAVWTAEKVNPRIEGNSFVVDVEIYKDDVLVKTERFTTSQDQPSDWPSDGVKRLIRSLQDVPTLLDKITAGDMTLPADTVIDVAEREWMNDFHRAEKAKILVDAGVIQANNAKYTALLTRLRNNFLPAYFDIL